MNSSAIDHLVLPVGSLDVARARLQSIGFTVAPDGVHPFGTCNACVFFADGTYLEPLAELDADGVSAAVEAGNAFIVRNRLFRQAVGTDGFSALVLRSSDVTADHARFVESGISAGEILDFSRDMLDASGRVDVASFRLAFAAPQDTASLFAIACERVRVPAVDRTALQQHPNGVTRIVGVTAVADEPERLARFCTTLTRSNHSTRDGGFDVPVGSAKVSIVEPATIFAQHGAAPHVPRFWSVTFGLPALAPLVAHLEKAAIRFDRDERRVVVPPAPGQGATFIFEEQP